MPLELFSELSHNFDVKFTDHNLNVQHLNSQEQLLKNKVPNYQELHVENFLELLEQSDTLVIGHPISNRNYKANLYNHPKTLNIIDLTDSNIDLANSKHQYHNIFNPRSE